MSLANETFTAQKNKRKKLRVMLQFIFIFLVAAICVNALFTLKSYESYSAKNTKFAGDKGFIALSYFGVERMGNQSLIGVDRLREHLTALKGEGYVTITQQDVIDYYESGKELPEKALLLIFEDGRRDTAIFSQKILEELNYKATALIYPEKFERQDTKFLLPPELKDLESSTFWEMGTNGYRLAFINVFDRYNNFLGELDPLEHARVAPYLGRKYNHYLMDYIRDEYGIPKESYTGMENRISYDYEKLKKSYTESMGYVPGMYILMHSNTGSFGNNDKVSAVNEYWIKKLFSMNFNREGFSLNQRNSSIYDLTRMQPQAYWYTNHLLMRIKDDCKEEVTFVKGDLTRQQQWDMLKGALEVKEETLVLTSLPYDKGLICLKDSSEFGDVKVSVRLKGNKAGLQKIYLRADEDLNRFLSVAVLNNVLYISEKNQGGEQELLKLNLDILDDKEKISIPEDKKAAEIREIETFIKYADTLEKAKIYTERLKGKSTAAAPSVSEGADEYMPDINLNAQGNRTLLIALKGNKVTVKVDDKEAVRDLKVSGQQAGGVYLESAWGGYGWSQRNLADDVYDGVFEKLIITENTGAEEEKALYDGRLQGFDAVYFKIRQMWETLINWFLVIF